MVEGCWVTGCSQDSEVKVANVWVPLVEPVESCPAHLGDLLGNMAKAALKTLPTESLTLQITPLD